MRNKIFLSSRTRISVALMLCFVIIGIIIYHRYNVKTEDSVIAVMPTAYDSPDNARLLEAEPGRKILLFSFEFAKDAASPFKLKSLDEYNGHPESMSVSAGDYTFSVIEQGNPVYTTSFSTQAPIAEKFHDDGKIERLDTDDQKYYAIRTPRFKDGSTYIIRDNKGTILLESTVRSVVRYNNEADYKTFIAD